MKQLMNALAASAILTAVTMGACLADSPKLIEWGWDEPTAQSLHAGILRMEKAPFNGVVLTAEFNENGKPVNFSLECFGKRSFTREQLKPTVDDLKATPFSKFTDNFLRFNTAPGDVDWYDDDGWKAILENGSLAAWICQEGNLKGLMFDTEQYKNKPFHYEERPLKSSHSKADYETMARRRGRELAEAMIRVKPDITILFTLANTILSEPTAGAAFKSSLDLLPAFLDGMIEGSGERATLVDAMEVAYPSKTETDFDRLITRFDESSKYSKNPSRYRSKMQKAFGIWLDCDWRNKGWDPKTTAKNHFQPDELKNSLELALAKTDHYVWLYSEKVNWWTGGGLSPAYISAVTDAVKAPIPEKTSGRHVRRRRSER